MPNYGDPSYWESAYNEIRNTTFDWLEDYKTLKPIFDEIKLDFNSRILMLGCGNSELSENLYDDGYRKINNIDISGCVINSMTERNKKRDEMKCNYLQLIYRGSDGCKRFEI